MSGAISVTGRWTVHQGESLRLLRDMPDASVDALITDPPYSSGGFTRGDRTDDTRSKYVKTGAAHDLGDFAGDNRDQHSFIVWCSIWLTECLRVCKEGAPVAVFSDWRQLAATTDALQVGGFIWRGVGTWTKDNCSRPRMGRFRADAEFLVWGSRGPMPANVGVGVLPGTCACAPVPHGSRVHMTQKPEKVMDWATSIVPPGGIILDPFCGSGSTGVSALRGGRQFIGIEQDAAYAQVARDRLAAQEQESTLEARLVGQGALFATPQEVA